MYKNILFILLMLFSGIGAYFLFQSDDVRTTKTVTQPSKPLIVDASSKRSDLSQEQNGIEVIIESVDQRPDATILTVGLNNHQFDLGQESIFKQATLNGQPSTSSTLISNAAGGHHVQAQIVFEKTTGGAFAITPVEETTFTFEDIWSQQPST